MLFTTGSSNLVLADFGALYWFEHLFGIESHMLSDQRWGLAARYFQTLSSATDQYGNSITLTGINGSLRYRFLQGVWNRDPAFGISAEVQQVNYSTVTGTMVGGGLFYGHLLPSGIDNFLNKIKFLRYPKWFDADFQIYPVASDIILGTNFNFFAELKLFLKPFFYVNIGGGFKNLDYSKSFGTVHAQASASYSLLGFGFTF